MEDKPTMEDILRQAALNPKSGAVDGQQFTSHSLKELMELDRYLRAKKAQETGQLGFRIIKTTGGSVND